ncbi:MAG: pentapeptide repeat-containing protein [Chloroflexota bacterium]
MITVAVLERLNARRQDKQELTRLKALLGSNEAVVTKIAISELRARGWLRDGSLRDASLFRANLSSSDLEEADLSGANLGKANLSGADLRKANLAHANLNNATLPDGTIWTPITDMTRFTDPAHPDFWSNKDLSSFDDFNDFDDF